MLADRLLPCPFCGNTQLLYGYAFEPGMKDSRRIECGKCGAEGPIRDGKTEAATAWNDRNNTAKCPIEIEHNGKQYRITAFVEVGGMSMNGNGSPEIDKLCRAQWLSPYGWKKIRNVNLLAELRQICEAQDCYT